MIPARHLTRFHRYTRMLPSGLSRAWAIRLAVGAVVGFWIAVEFAVEILWHS